MVSRNAWQHLVAELRHTVMSKWIENLREMASAFVGCARELLAYRLDKCSSQVNAPSSFGEVRARTLVEQVVSKGLGGVAKLAYTPF